VSLAREQRRSGATPVRLRRVQADGFLDLASIHALVERRAAERFAEVGLEGITPQQSNVLLALFQERRALTAREISRALAVSEVTVSRFVKALMSNGWVERSVAPGDARARPLAPTRKAREAFGRFLDVSNGLFDEAFEGLTVEEIERHADVLRRIRTNLSQSPR
jgi:DNA-binding MarR family transcriptional regulator